MCPGMIRHEALSFLTSCLVEVGVSWTFASMVNYHNVPGTLGNRELMGDTVGNFFLARYDVNNVRENRSVPLHVTCLWRRLLTSRIPDMSGKYLKF